MDIKFAATVIICCSLGGSLTIIGYCCESVLGGQTSQSNHLSSLCAAPLSKRSRISVGRQPETADELLDLKQQGIQTIVSVDGAKPDFKTASRLGFCYVHLPIGYDGVPKETQAALAKLLTSTEGKIYIHCHHGKHRGPAVAAIAGMIEGLLTKDEALALMKKCGTGGEYAGLWKSVRDFQRPAPDAPSAPLVEVAKVEPLTAAMVRIDECFDHLTEWETTGWKSKTADEKPSENPPSTSAADPSFKAEALLLMEEFRESARLTGDATDKEKKFAAGLHHAEGLAKALYAALGKKDFQSASHQLQMMRADCRACHKQFRN